MVAQLCLIKKAKLVIGVDCIPERIHLAKSLGIQVIDFSKGDPVKDIFDLTSDGLDSAIECVGNEYSTSWIHRFERALHIETDPTTDVLSQCITAVKKCGIVSMIGVHSGYINNFPIGALMEKGITLNGGHAPIQKYWKKAAKKILSGELDPSFLITHRGTFAEGPILFKKFTKREEGILKVFLQPDSPSLLTKPAEQS
jgi:threonine dehydrogenase-like Zn-dependent dehydrogenase